MENEMSSVLKRYYKNKEKYNERAKNYFNEIYYPKHKDEILKKGKETRQKIQKKRQQQQTYIYKKEKIIHKVTNHSLIVSFD